MNSTLNFQAEPFAYQPTLAEGEQGEWGGTYGYRSRYGRVSGSSTLGRTTRSRTSYKSTSATSSPMSSVYGSSGGSSWTSRSPWRRYRYASATGSSQGWIAWAQRRLRRWVGSWVPLTGKIGPSTRRALRIFQSRRGLAVTGLLDSATMEALRSAWTTSGLAATPPPSEPGPGPEDASPEPGADAGGDAAAAEPGGDGADAPSPEGDEGELFSSDAGLQREFFVSDGCQVQIRRHDAVPLTDTARLERLSRTPGIYVIHVDGQPWYVGVAERSVHLRLKERMKVLRDLNIPVSALAQRSVSWFSMRSGALPSCAIGRRTAGAAAAGYRPLKGVYAALKVLEQYFIKALGTSGKGNRQRESVRFGPSGSLLIREEGKPDVKVSGTSLQLSGR